MMVAQMKERRKGSSREKSRLRSPAKRTKKAMMKTFWRLMVNSFFKRVSLKRAPCDKKGLLNKQPCRTLLGKSPGLFLEIRLGAPTIEFHEIKTIPSVPEILLRFSLQTRFEGSLEPFYFLIGLRRPFQRLLFGGNRAEGEA